MNNPRQFFASFNGNIYLMQYSEKDKWKQYTKLSPNELENHPLHNYYQSKIIDINSIYDYSFENARKEIGLQ